MERKLPLLSEEEYKCLYLCDDLGGLICLIANKLSISEKKAEEILTRLINEGFVVPGEHEKEWHYATDKGKDYLKTYGDQFDDVDYDF